jgi:hypothetical protein
MFDDVNEQVQETVETPEQVEQVEEVQAAPEPVQPQKPGPQESFRQLREQKERIQAERDEALRLLQQYQQPKQEAEPDEDLGIGDNELAEGRHLSKVGKKIKKLENTIKQYEQQAQMNMLELKIKTQFPDFESVVNDQTVAQLKEQHPEIAQALQSTQDVYSKAASAYKLIKQFGIVQDNSYDSDKKVIRNNFAKPKTSATLSPQHGTSPLSAANAFANGLTDDVKSKLWQEMKEIKRNF